VCGSLTLIEISKLTCKIGNVYAVRDVSLELYKNDTAFLIGVNGAGKTTLLRSVMNLIPKVSGKIIFMGTDITSLPTYEIAKLGISYVPEDCGVFPNLTVEEQLMMPIWILRRKKPSQAIKDQSKVMLSIEDVFYMFPQLKARRKSKGIYLSGGERKMLGIARAILTKAQLILLDEPFEGLAPSIVKTIQQFLDNSTKTLDISWLISSTSEKHAFTHAKKFFIDRGEITR